MSILRPSVRVGQGRVRREGGREDLVWWVSLGAGATVPATRST